MHKDLEEASVNTNFFTLRACHRHHDWAAIAKVFVEIRQKVDFAHFSDVSARLGSRELRAVKIPASYALGDHKNVEKTIREKIDFLGFQK